MDGYCAGNHLLSGLNSPRGKCRLEDPEYTYAPVIIIPSRLCAAAGCGLVWLVNVCGRKNGC